MQQAKVNHELLVPECVCVCKCMHVCMYTCMYACLTYMGCIIWDGKKRMEGKKREVVRELGSLTKRTHTRSKLPLRLCVCGLC